MGEQTDQPAASPFVISLRSELQSGALRPLGKFSLGDLTVALCCGADSVWVLVRRPDQGGLALRAAYIPVSGFACRKMKPGPDEAARLEVESLLGRFRIGISVSDEGLHRLRVCASLRPASDLRLPFLPRDLYPLGEKDDPLGARGNVEAAQRGVNSGLAYFRIDRPAFGSVLYFQNLTALNRYFQLTGTKPDGVVGGEWPELGYLPPIPPAQEGGEGLLPAGEEVVLSDAILVFRDWAADNEQEMARQFLQMLGAAYRVLDPPPVTYRDWLWRAERTLADLESAKPATVRHYGHRYVMPYVEGEVPDSMVQMTVIASLHRFGQWRGEPLPLEADLKKGLGRFHDARFKMLRRFLPNAGDRKNLDEVDSWYLYHPLINLARLALDGDAQAHALLFSSIDYGIRSARHFKYRWPILYRIDDFSVVTRTRGDDGFGQTDVNGLYAYLMLQLYQLTSEKLYLDEAKAAIETVKGLRFDLLYQANLSVWGAVACLRLWRITQDKDWLAQSYVYVAGVLHNCEIWASRLDQAIHYSNFLGTTALHDGPYMAMFECFECFAGFEEYLRESGPDLEPAAKMLISEYCKYTLERGWFYFPDTLPKEAIQEGHHQSGKVDPKLSFPLEDLYGDGQPAGQVGQEIYGAGAPFIFASTAFHTVDGAPFRLFCNHFLRTLEHTGERAISLQLDGGETCTALLSVVRLKRRSLPVPSVHLANGDALQPHKATPDRIDFEVPASGRLMLRWKDA